MENDNTGTNTDLPHYDGWYGEASGLGGSQDKTEGMTFRRRCPLDRDTLEALYEQNPIAARIVDRIVDDGTRAGFDVTDVKDADGNAIEINQAQLESWLDDYGVTKALRQAGKWSRLYGGAVITLAILDQQKPDQPAQPSPSTPLVSVAVVSAAHARPLEQDVGIFSATFGRVLKYQIDGIASTAQEVHYTRAISMEAVKLPVDSLQLTRAGTFTGWGPSVLERVFDDLMRDGAAASHAVSMLFSASVLWAKLKNFTADRTAKDGRERMNIAAANIRSVLNGFKLLLMGEGDEVGSHTIQMSGAPEVLDRARERLAAATPYPKEILFNESPAGLNAGQLSGPQEIYYAGVAQWQEDELTPVLDQILAVVFASKGIPAASWNTEWRPLFTKSDETAAETHSKNATADQIYLDQGVVSADEVRTHRFVDGNAGPLEVAAAKEPEDTELAPEDFAAQSAAEAPTVADEALNGAQSSALLATMEKLNAGAINYEQAKAWVRVSFPNYRGREADAIGPPPENVTPAAPPEQETPSALPQPGDAMRIQDVASRFGLSTATISAMIRRGDVPYWGFGAHKVVSAADVLAAAKKHEQPPDDLALAEPAA